MVFQNGEMSRDFFPRECEVAREGTLAEWWHRCTNMRHDGCDALEYCNLFGYGVITRFIQAEKTILAGSEITECHPFSKSRGSPVAK